MRKLSAQLFPRSACRAVRRVASETPTDAVQHGADHQDVAAGSDRTRRRSADAAGVKRRSGSVSRRTPDGSVSDRKLVRNLEQVTYCHWPGHYSLFAPLISDWNQQNYRGRPRTATVHRPSDLLQKPRRARGRATVVAPSCPREPAGDSYEAHYPGSYRVLRSRARVCASAICSGVIFSAARASRSWRARSRPVAAARLSHICAET